MNVLLGCLFLLLQEGASADWWNPEWKHRRKIAVKNNLEGRLEAGYPLAVLLDAKYLELDGKKKDGLADLTVVHRGKALPFALFEGPSEGTHLLWFKTAAPLDAGSRDAGYAVYYGNPGAPDRSGTLASVFDVFEDFEKADRTRKRVEPDDDLRWSVRDGALVIREVSPARTEPAPAEIRVKTLPRTPGFALEFDLWVEAAKGAVLDCAVNVELKRPEREDPKMDGRVAELILQLGDADFEIRERATGDLLKLGGPAVPRLVLATRSKDPEVKWRAEHLLRRIEEKTAPPRITAGIRIGHDRINPRVARASIRGDTSVQVLADDGPVRVSILRDQDGDVTLLWNNESPQTGSMPGDIGRIYFSIHKGVAGPMGRIRIDNLSLRRHVDDDSRPTYTVEVEETRP